MISDRFSIAYNIGEGLKPEEVMESFNNDDVRIVKIKDNKGELPDLVVENEKVAKTYVTYFNNLFNVSEIDEAIENIQGNIDYLNEFNDKLIAPEPVLMGVDENDDPVYDVPLKESLYYTGYQSRVNQITNNINNNLLLIKNIIFKE